MTKFKAGDKFIPRKPVDSMALYAVIDEHWGKVFTVNSIENEWIRSVEYGYRFHKDWCEKVEDNQSVETNEMVESSERAPEVGKTITPEHLRISLALAGIYTDERCADLTLRVLEKVQELGVNFTINDACEIRGKWEQDYQEISEK